MGQQHIIAVDSGATSGRVILATPDGRKLRTEEPNRFPNRLTRIFGHRHRTGPASAAER